MKLLVFAGSTRTGSWNRMLAAVTAGLARAAGADVTHLELGDSLADFLRALDLNRSGGKRGDITRLRDQMRKLFASHISVEYSGETSWEIQHMQLAQKAVVWWDPQDENDAGIWKSTTGTTQRTSTASSRTWSKAANPDCVVLQRACEVSDRVNPGAHLN